INKSLPANQDQINTQNYQIKTIRNLIEEINEKNKIKQNFYIVDSLKMDVSDINQFGHHYYFKDLHTNLGDKLPEFVKPPFVIPMPSGSSSIELFDIDEEGFSAGRFVEFSNDFDDKRKIIYFNIIVFESK